MFVKLVFVCVHIYGIVNDYKIKYEDKKIVCSLVSTFAILNKFKATKKTQNKKKMLINIIMYRIVKVAQWLCSRVLDSRPKGRWL